MLDFLKDEDEENQSTERPEVLQAAKEGRKVNMDPTVAEHVAKREPALWEQYQKLAGDTSAIDKVAGSAKRREFGLGLVEGMTRYGGGDLDLSQAKKDVRGEVDAARAAHKQKLADLLTGDKLKYQDVERERAAKEFNNQETKWGRDAEKHGWDQRVNDPNSDTSRAAAAVTAKEFGVDPRMLDGLSYEEIKGLRLQKKDAGPAAAKLVLTSVENPETGATELAWANPNTGQVSFTGIRKGFAQGFDSTTGTHYSKAAPGAGASDMMVAGRGTMADRRTELTGERAHASETGKQQAKDEEAVQVAESTGVRKAEMVDRYMDLYDKADKEGTFGGVGPIAGRVSQAKNALGISAGESTDKLITDLQRDINQYIKDTTGAAMSEPEAARLMKVMPAVGMDREMFKARLDAARAEADRIIADRRRVAGSPRTGPSSTAPEGGGFPRTVTRKNPETGRTESATVGNASELQEAQAEGFK